MTSLFSWMSSVNSNEGCPSMFWLRFHSESLLSCEKCNSFKPLDILEVKVYSKFISENVFCSLALTDPWKLGVLGKHRKSLHIELFLLLLFDTFSCLRSTVLPCRQSGSYFTPEHLRKWFLNLLPCNNETRWFSLPSIYWCFFFRAIHFLT